MKTYMKVKSGTGKNRYGKLIALKKISENDILKSIKHPDEFINNSGNGVKLRKHKLTC